MNRVNVIPLLTTSMMTPAERAKGRFMRAPDGHDDSSGGGDNTSGNGDGDGNGTPNGDNTSPADELATFWEDKPDEKPAGESDDDETAQESQALGQQLGGLIKQFKGPEVFTKEIADKIADGDLAGVNEAMAARDQAMMQHNMVVTAKLIGGVIDRLSADFDARIQRALGNKDSEVALETHFPLAKDPTMRPMVQRVWDQAMKNSKGNKDEAIRLTRGMLQAFGSKTSIREAPEDPTAGIGTAASKSLVADLLSRDG